MSKMIKRVAQAIGELRDKYGAAGPSDNELARAAIAVMREPTKEMWLQGDDAVNWYDDIAKSMDVWRAMIDCALEEK